MANQIVVKAIFRGQDGSLGYETHKEYTLIVSQSYDDIHIERNGGGGECDYGSIMSFINNWDNIRKV